MGTDDVDADADAARLAAEAPARRAADHIVAVRFFAFAAGAHDPRAPVSGCPTGRRHGSRKIGNVRTNSSKASSSTSSSSSEVRHSR